MGVGAGASEIQGLGWGGGEGDPEAPEYQFADSSSEFLQSGCRGAGGRGIPAGKSASDGAFNYQRVKMNPPLLTDHEHDPMEN